MYVSNKVKDLPPYLFSRFQKRKEALKAQGVDVIDLGIGAPDLPTPKFIIDKLCEEVQNPSNHRYSPYDGSKEFREAVAYFYQNHYGVELDPDTEILALIGSKEGIANLMQATINPGDRVLIPDPGYPVYQTAVHLAGGYSTYLPLDIDNGYVPMFDRLLAEDIQEAKLMFLNYPGNPTAATVELDTFVEAVAFGGKNQIAVIHDAAYDLVTFDGYKSPSILQVPKAKEVAIEFGSLSKSFNMTGWRIGYVVGNKELIKALHTYKSNIDTSQFLSIQKAAAHALKSDLADVRKHNEIFKVRMERMYKGLTDAGFQLDKPRGSIFVWPKIPPGYLSGDFAHKLLEEAGIIVTPGTAFGPSGEGYIRIALSVELERIDEVIRRIKEFTSKGVRPS
ncbi:aminotransferase class I/II-fold pyridoxal phosphate-dependent enzyme [Ornithinibacillus sp. BX22]|uniref:Aminotransferase n=1 Tax=Ornithinibacillus hominis TaxID=2763055 RepID=A0A923L4D0_9BACI|nr:aminotransferase class I/II-fold pyridoxal phosphate-dependent enzyme [Ornithinibacillus hominis]MBC5636181.1 aminotransferase class I/II-fold pyridoxal phosphate-dependent enzyme [Ornithinibacillus hominis]